MQLTGHCEATSCKSQFAHFDAFTLATPSCDISKQSGQLFTHKPQPTQVLSSIVTFAMLFLLVIQKSDVRGQMSDDTFNV
jgi:hypothetical protein